ncbi:hypothetical protein ALC60_12716 [Trachymyrmex zeteki]|uniref:Uncharacterized protein n=1 Tax=Mycetomoellerius zeteki TaxID=64791 RepID=A0A151WK73_9HYME|nr:hypothetical protein ALC60_12716 [Trachymyrmex zeteki]
MGSVDLTHVSGASSTQEVPYARFYLIVIYGAGCRDAATLNNARNRATYAYTAIPQSGRSWSVDDRPISVDGFAASTIKFKARQLVPHAGTTTAMRTSLRGGCLPFASCHVPIYRRGAPEEFAIVSVAERK